MIARIQVGPTPRFTPKIGPNGAYRIITIRHKQLKAENNKPYEAWWMKESMKQNQAASNKN